MTRWSWTRWPVEIGADHDGPTWTTRRATLADVRQFGQTEYWLVRVRLVTRKGETLTSSIVEVEHKELRVHQLPLGLVSRTCVCGAEWDPPMSGRTSEYCPNCRYDRRREYFAERRRAARATEEKADA